MELMDALTAVRIIDVDRPVFFFFGAPVVVDGGVDVDLVSFD